MNRFSSIIRWILAGILASQMLLAGVNAADTPSSSLGEVAVPQPAKPADADACVEPVDIMRREHMNFLLHQRDATVLDGERGNRYSLTGCLDCHNPSSSAETAVRYPDPEHFCAGCHLYASVRIDCFECHADRGMSQLPQGALGPVNGSDLTALQTFRSYPGAGHGE